MSNVTSTTSDSTLSLAHIPAALFETDLRPFPSRLILIILSVGYEKHFLPHFGS